MVKEGQPLRVGIIGTGWGLRVQLPLFRRAGLQVTAIYSRSLEKAKSLAEKHKIAHAFDSVELLCSCADVDLVCVSSPTFSHAEHAAIAVKCGKHVLSEKPLASTLAQANGLRDVLKSKKEGQVFFVGHELRFLQCVQVARDFIATKKIGDLRSVLANFVGDMKGLGKFHSWWHTEDGGVLFALGVHVIDLCHRVTDDKIARVSADRGVVFDSKPLAQGGSRKNTGEDFFSFVGTTEQGAHTTVVVNGATTAPPRRILEFVGTAGSAVLDLVNFSFTAFDSQGRNILTHKDKVTMPEAFPEGTLLMAQAIAQIPSGNHSLMSVACSFEDAYYVQQVATAVRKSLGQAVFCAKL